MQRLFAILIGVMYAASSSAADTVANALARAVQIDDRVPSGLRAGDGYWQMSAGPDDWWLRLQSEYTGAGVVYRRASTEFCIAIGGADREAVYEMSWRIELAKGFALRSDVQFVRNPGMDATIDSSWTIGLRFELGAR